MERVLTIGGNKTTRPVTDFMVNVSTEFYVGPNKSGAGDDGRAGKSKKTSLATLTKALSLATASKNDIIYLLPGHAETIATAGGININKIGVRVIGLGTGALRPTFTFSAVDATMTLTAASTSIENVIVRPSIDSVVSPIVVSAADCAIDIELQDASAQVECVRAVLTTAGADRLNVKVRHRGFIAGDACVNSVRLVGVDTAKVHVDFYGVASTSIVEFHTTACHDVKIDGQFYNSGTTNLLKNVIDTITGSTWSVDGFDGAAGAPFSGGSGNAIAAGDLSVIASDVTTIKGYHAVPTANATTDAFIRDVIGRKTDAAANAVAGTKSLVAYLKGIVNEITAPAANNTANGFMNDVVGQKGDAKATGAVTATDTLVAYIKQLVTQNGIELDTNTLGALLAGANGIATMPAAAVPANNVNIFELLRSIWGNLCGTAAGENGIAVFPAPAAAGNNVSIAEVLRYIQSSQLGTIVNAGGTATLGAILGDFANVTLLTKLLNIQNQANRTTAAKNVASVTTANLFTVGTGPVRLLGIAGHITTAIQASANATKLVHTSTSGAAIDLCATLDVTGSAVRKLLTITGTKANAMALSADEGVIVDNLATPLILTPGVLSLNCAASTTGVINWYVLYEPLAPGANMVAA